MDSANLFFGIGNSIDSSRYREPELPLLLEVYVAGISLYETYIAYGKPANYEQTVTTS